MGRYPSVSLAEARKRARAALAKISDGVDPVAERQREARRGSFDDLQKDYLSKYARLEKAEKSWKNDEWMIDRHLLPRWRHVKAADITRRHVRDVVEPVAADRPVLANRLLALISGIFAFAVSHDWRADNPAAGVQRRTESPRRRLLADDEIRRIWDALDREDPFFEALFKLRFLTASRAGEIQSMRWSDVNLLSGLWTIPSERSKNRLPTTVPLTPHAVRLLQRLRDWQEARFEQINVGRRKKKLRDLTKSEWVFPSARHDSYFEWEQRAAQRIRDRSGVDFRFHDVRRTVATRLTSTCGVDRFLLKRILNHVDGDITGVYDLNTYDVKKRIALEQWERKLLEILRDEPQSANVLSMVAANS